VLLVKNWAKTISFTPQEIVAPKSQQEIQRVILKAQSEKKVIRVRGSHHSWTELNRSEDYFLHLDHLQGISDVNPQNGRAKVLAGTKLSRMGDEAFDHGWAMANQGDINRQSLAGATSTGTHGTGITLQSIANQLTSLSWVNASGEVQLTHQQDPLFKALALSLGSLGILYEMEIQLVPCYKLKEVSEAKSYAEIAETLRADINDNRHFEFFYFPLGDWAIVKKMNLTEDEITPISQWQQRKKYFLETHLYETLNILATKSGNFHHFDKLMRHFVNREVRVDWSHRLFPSYRNILFHEMEFNLPIQAYHDAFSDLKKMIKKRKIQTLFPIEVRFVKGDDLWLSPAFQRDSVYLALHTYRQQDCREYFSGAQEIFKHYQGRAPLGEVAFT
jgi:hypothetical protein